MNDYQIIQEFIIELLDGLRHRWKLDDGNDRLPTRLFFETRLNAGGFCFKCLENNRLGVDFFSINIKKEKKSLLKTILDIEAIPDLMEYLTMAGEMNFQLGIKTASMEKYAESDSIINSMLANKPMKDYSVQEDKDNISILYKNKEYAKVWLEEMNLAYLGALALNCYIKPLDEELAYTVQYQKIIPQHKIADFPILTKLVQLPKYDKEFNKINAVELIKSIDFEEAKEFKHKILNFLLNYQLNINNDKSSKKMKI